MQEIVASGQWMYDGAVAKPVHVVEQDYDFWFEVARADGRLEPGEAPELNDDGRAFYVLFADPSERPWGVESIGFTTAGAAKRWAESRLSSPVSWHPVAV